MSGEPEDALNPDELRPVLRELYAELEAEIARLAPVCRLSGRCCRFAEFDHTLFVSAPEAVLLLADAPPPVRPLDGGKSCPWQDRSGRCTAREARPLGCRVFFCDPGYDGHAAVLSEAFIGRLKKMADDSGWPWGYAPLHVHLRRALSEGRFQDAADASP